MICSHSCPCWDLKGERLCIHYCFPENLILQGIGIVSFVSYYNSLINNDSVDLNMGKRSSKALSDQHWTQGYWRCSAALEGDPSPIPFHEPHIPPPEPLCRFYRGSCWGLWGGQKEGHVALLPSHGQPWLSGQGLISHQVQPPYPRKTLSPVLCSQAAGPGVHQVMRRKLERLCLPCSPLIMT